MPNVSILARNIFIVMIMENEGSKHHEPVKTFDFMKRVTFLIHMNIFWGFIFGQFLIDGLNASQT